MSSTTFSTGLAVWADVRAAEIADIASVGLLDDRAVLASEGAVFIAEHRGVCFFKGHRVVERGGAEAIIFFA